MIPRRSLVLANYSVHGQKEPVRPGGAIIGKMLATKPPFKTRVLNDFQPAASVGIRVA